MLIQSALKCTIDKMKSAQYWWIFDIKWESSAYSVWLQAYCKPILTGPGNYTVWFQFKKDIFILNFCCKKRKPFVTGIHSRYHDDPHQIEAFSALLALCAGNSPVTGEFPSQSPVTRSFDVFLDLRPNKRLSKQSRHRWCETSSRSFWRHCNDRGHFILITHKWYPKAGP